MLPFFIYKTGKNPKSDSNHHWPGYQETDILLCCWWEGRGAVYHCGEEFVFCAEITHIFTFYRAIPLVGIYFEGILEKIWNDIYEQIYSLLHYL